MLAIIMSFSAMALPVFAEEIADEEITAVETVEEEVVKLNEKIAEKFAKMQAFGLFTSYDEEKVIQNDVITRGEFAILAAAMRGADLENVSSESPFSDVSSSDEYGPSIAYLVAIGAIDGVTEDKYHPEEPVSLAEAVKILTDLMGYQIDAINKGGYHDGYLSAATQIGYYTNVLDREALTTQDVINLIWSALDTEIVQVAGLAERELILTIDNDNTALSAFLSTYRVRGIVDANEFTALIGKTKAEKGKAKVNGFSYLDPDHILTDYIGYEVEIYFQVTEDGYKVVYAAPSKNVEEIKIPARNLLTSHGSFSQFNIVYIDENGRIEQESLPENLNFIYNSEQYFNFTVADWNILSGNVILVSNNGGSTFTTAIVENYESHVVDIVNKSSNTVVTKLGAELSLKTNDGSENVIWDFLGGYGSGIENLSQWSVISLKRSKSGDYLKVVVGDFYIEGVIESFETEDSKTTVTVDGTEYPLYLGYVPGAHTLTPVLRKGETAIFYFDRFDNIVIVEYSDMSFWQYGVLYEIKEYEQDEILNFRIFGIDGLHHKFNANQRIKIDGTVVTNKRGAWMAKVVAELQKGDLFRYNSVDGVESIYSPAPGSDYVYQVVRYQTDDEGNLAGLDTSYCNPTKEVGDSLMLFTDYPTDPTAPGVTIAKYKGEELSNRASYGQLGFKYYKGNNAPVMNLPVANDRLDKANYYVGTDGLGERGTINRVLVYGSKLADIGKVPLIVQFKPPVTTGNWSTYIMADRITKTLDENDDPVATLYAWEKGKEVVYTSKDVNMFDGIGRGDILRLDLDTLQSVLGVYQLYSAKDQKLVTSAEVVEKSPSNIFREVGLPTGVLGEENGRPINRDGNEIDEDDWHYLYEDGTSGGIGMGGDMQIMFTELYTLFGTTGSLIGVSAIPTGVYNQYKLARPSDIDYGVTDFVLLRNTTNFKFMVYDAEADKITVGSAGLKPWDVYRNSCSRIITITSYGENMHSFVFNY